jgi:hypothetical protein
MSQPILERRQHHRVPAGQHPGRLGLSVPVKVLDLSFAGALIETSTWLAPERQYPLRLEPGIHLTALVTRCALARVEKSADGPRTVYQAGLLFAPPTDQVRQQLLLLLRSLAQFASSTTPLPLEVDVAV